MQGLGLALTGGALEAWSFEGCRNPTFIWYVGIEHLASLVAQECGGLRVSLSLILTWLSARAAERLRAQLAEGIARSHRTLPPEASHTHLTPDTDPSFSTFSLRRSARRPRVERGAFDETSLPSLGEESRRGGNAHTLSNPSTFQVRPGGNAQTLSNPGTFQVWPGGNVQTLFNPGTFQVRPGGNVQTLSSPSTFQVGPGGGGGGGGGSNGAGAAARDADVSGGGMVAVGTRRPPTGRVASIV